MENSMEVLKKLKIELPYDSAVPLLGIYPEENMIWKGACTPVLIAALVTVAKTWEQPECASPEEWIQKIWYIHSPEYYSAIKKNEIMLFAATWIELGSVILSEVWHPLYVELKKKWYN